MDKSNDVSNAFAKLREVPLTGVLISGRVFSEYTIPTRLSCLCNNPRYLPHPNKPITAVCQNCNVEIRST